MRPRSTRDPKPKLYHFGTGPVIGVQEGEILAAFDSAIGLASAFAPAHIHAVELALNTQGLSQALRYARAYLALNPIEPTHRGIRESLGMNTRRRQQSSAPSPKDGRSRLGDEIAAWLRRSLHDEEGKRRLTDREVIGRSGVSRAWFYRMLKGEGGGSDDTTLKALADALGVPAPRVERRLTWDPPPEPESPLAMVRAAKDLLDRLAARLNDA